MTAPAVVNEFGKMRRLHVGPMALALIVGVAALAAPGLTADPASGDWPRLLAAMAFAVPLVSPVLLAVLASRQVDLEHRGQGWLLSHTAGFPPGRLCRAKLLALGALVIVATVLQSGTVAALGVTVRLEGAFPAGSWLAFTASVAAVNLVLLAAHLLLAVVVRNQLVGLGVAVLGVFVGVVGSVLPPAVAHLLPWAYYALVTPVDYRGGVLVGVAPSHLGVLLLAVVAGSGFLVATRALDRQEA